MYGILVFGMRASPDIEHALSWERAFSPVIFLAGVALYHFSVRYTFAKVKGKFIAFLYSICIILVPLTAAGLIIDSMQIKSYGYAPIWGPVAPVFILVTYTLTIATLVTLIRYPQAEPVALKTIQASLDALRAISHSPTGKTRGTLPLDETLNGILKSKQHC